VIGLDLDCFDPDSGQIKVISGKGRKDRAVYATSGTLDAILD
jgi:site-specific recombinase XerC